MDKSNRPTFFPFHKKPPDLSLVVDTNRHFPHSKLEPEATGVSLFPAVFVWEPQITTVLL